MTTQLSWGTADVEMDFDWAEGPFTMAGLRMGAASLRFDDPLPLAHVITATEGHDFASSRLIHTVLGNELRYQDHRTTSGSDGDRIDIDLASASEMRVTISLHIPHQVLAVRAEMTITNGGAAPCTLRSAATWASRMGTDSRDSDFRRWTLRSAESDWMGESRWTDVALRNNPTFPELGLEQLRLNPRGALRVTSSGTWSTGRYLPTAALISGSATWLWQIEHNGPWRWEIGEDSADGYFALSGPTEDDHSWSVILAPGQSFTTVPAVVTLGADFDTAVEQMTDARRSSLVARPSEPLPLVFNDYMNTLSGDPTTERLLPLIDAAATAGAEIFVIDAGWYDDGFNWWDSVGEWRPSTRRFPNGLGEVIDRIRAHGMTPGLWLEPEVVGVRSPIADVLPRQAFLMRNGQRIIEQGRYHLDLRHPAATAHLDEVLDRLIEQFHVGYFKFDYNINAGAGTDRDADSVGAGLLDHNRAHLAWIQRVRDRHPDVVLENCGSGGMRADYATLRVFDLQSTTDQQDEARLPAITSATLLSVLPEQAAHWAYPAVDMGAERAAFCLTIPMLGRYMLSGYLSRMDAAGQQLAAEAVRAYKSIRASIPESHPFWPTGIPKWNDPVVTSGLRTAERDLVTIWSREQAQTVSLQLTHRRGRQLHVSTVFPASLPEWSTTWDPDAGILHVEAAAGLSARTLRLTEAPG